MEKLLDSIGLMLGITIVRYFLIAGIFFLVFYKLLAGKLNRSKIQSRIAANRDYVREVSYSLVSCLVFAIIGAVILYTPLVHYTLIYHRLDAYPLWYLPVSVALSLIIHDTYFYWMHRLLHHRSLFRFAHLVHHKSVNPSPWASYSFHIAESVLEGGIMVVLAFVLPMHPLAIFLFVLLGFIINVYGHLGYEIMPRGLRNSWLFEVLNTSVHHNLLHSKFKGNYGLYFRVWDRLCGTEHPEYVKEYDKIQRQRFGEERPVNNIEEKRMTA